MEEQASAGGDAHRVFVERSARETAELSDLVGELVILRDAALDAPPDLTALHSCLEELDELLANFPKKGPPLGLEAGGAQTRALARGSRTAASTGPRIDHTTMSTPAAKNVSPCSAKAEGSASCSNPRCTERAISD